MRVDHFWTSCGSESKETRNALSPFFITLWKNCAPAFTASSMRGCIEPEVSIASPIDSGRSFTYSNFAIETGFPSSRILNALSGSVVAGLPLTITDVGNSMRWTFNSSMYAGVHGRVERPSHRVADVRDGERQTGDDTAGERVQDFR